MVFSLLWKRRDRKRITELYDGAKRPRLRAVEDAIEVCKKYKVHTYDVSGSSSAAIGDTGSCCVCEETTQYSTFLPVPQYSYKRALELSEAEIRPLNVLRKRNGLPDYEPSIVLLKLGGMSYRRFICSQNCMASYALWSLLLPPFKKPRVFSGGVANEPKTPRPS